MVHGELGGRNRGDVVSGQMPQGLLYVQLFELTAGVDQYETVGGKPAEYVDGVEQCRVLDDEQVRRHHGLVQVDGFVVNADVGDHRCAHALGAEAGNGL